MTIEQLRQMHQARPFAPFRVHMADGRHLDVDHPEFLAQTPAGRPGFDGYVALGCVIRGETSHYDTICAESARKLQDLACDHGLAIGYGILTCENRDQAWARARVQEQNKGGGAAQACLAMLALKRHLKLA